MEQKMRIRKIHINCEGCKLECGCPIFEDEILLECVHWKKPSKVKELGINEERENVVEVEKKSCYENFSKYLEDLEEFKKKMSPRNREKKRFVIIKNPEYKKGIAHRKSGVGYTDNLIEYISWNINSFEYWGMLPIVIFDKKKGKSLKIRERKNWREIVSKWLNGDIESNVIVLKNRNPFNPNDVSYDIIEKR